MLAIELVAILAALRSASSSLTCFTCSSSSNEACNRKAIDQPCMLQNAVCMTTHTFMPDSLQSLSVEKKCVSQCNASLIGCHLSNQSPSFFYKICTYCCDKNYCNLNATLDSNESMAHSRSLLSSSASYNQPTNYFLFTLPFIFSTYF